MKSQLHALAASFFASASGMATQIATAPILLYILGITEFSHYIFATALASYIALAINGFFYYNMNKVVVESLKGEIATSEKYFSNMIFYIIVLLFVSLALLFANALIIHAAPIGASAAIVYYAINLCNIAFDARYRAASRYSHGTFLLSIFRAVDWLAMVALAYRLRETDKIFLYLCGYRAILTVMFAVYQEKKSIGPKIRFKVPSLATFMSDWRGSRSQLVVSISNSLSTIGPQLVVSALFPGHLSVIFNVYRTYLRVNIAVIGIGTAALWPSLSKWSSSKNIEMLNRYVRQGSVVALVAALSGIAFVSLLAPILFPIIFRGNIEIVPGWFLTIAATVAVGAPIAFLQSFFVATNLRSTTLFIGTLFGAAMLAVLFIAGDAINFTGALLVLLLSEVTVLMATIYASRSVLRRIRFADSVGAE